MKCPPERQMLSSLYDYAEQRCTRISRQSRPYKELETEYRRLISSGALSGDLQDLIANYLCQTQRVAYIAGLDDGAKLQHMLLSGSLGEVVLDIYGDKIREEGVN